MNTRLASLAVLTLLAVARLVCAEETAVATPAGLESITETELFDHVATLAADEMEGRSAGTKGHELARDYVVEAFKALGLEPGAGDGSYLQPLKSGGRRGRPRKKDAEDAQTIAGHNVLGVLPGRDEHLAKEYLILSAHYDHLGTKDGEICNGADDNASGVSALLELAEAFANLEGDQRPKRSILFASWDLEEVGLVGSTFWTKNPTVPLEQVVFMTSMDMLSRSFLGLLTEELMVLGSEHSTRVAEVVASTEVPEGMRIVQVGADLVGNRSDHAPFELKRVPYLFFTTATSKYYHTPEDDADSIDKAKLLTNTRYIYELMSEIANGERPSFNETPTRTIAEFENVLYVLDKVQENQDSFEPVEGLFETLGGIRDQVKAIIASGEIDETQREQLKLAAGFIVLQLQEK